MIKQRDALDAYLVSEVDRLSVEAERYSGVQEARRAAVVALDEARMVSVSVLQLWNSEEGLEVIA